MRRAVKVRLYPTPEQESLFLRTAGACRKVYNLGLGVRKDFYDEGGISVTTNDLMKMLPLWKEEFPFLGEVSAVALQQSLRNLDAAYQNFFRACKGEGKSRFPRFKTRNSRKAFRLTTAAFRVRDGQLFVAKNLDPVPFRDKSYDLPADSSSVTISLDAAGRWFASFVTDDVVALPPTTGERAVGVDLGVKTLAVTSDGVQYENEKRFALHASRLKRYQRQMARRKPAPGQKASNNYRKAQAKAGRIHARIADGRRDQIHKITTELARTYDVIIIEDLAVSGMLKSKRMSRSIADAGFGEFRRQLTYKTEWYGKRLVVIDRFAPTSKTCSDCGEKNPKLALSDRTWVCSGCGALHDRDLNAAKNILAVGQTVSACGGDVSPPLSSGGNANETGSSPSRAPARSAA
jgi:putative transposase